MLALVVLFSTLLFLLASFAPALLRSPLVFSAPVLVGAHGNCVYTITPPLTFLSHFELTQTPHFLSDSSPSRSLRIIQGSAFAKLAVGI